MNGQHLVISVNIKHVSMNHDCITHSPFCTQHWINVPSLQPRRFYGPTGCKAFSVRQHNALISLCLFFQVVSLLVCSISPHFAVMKIPHQSVSPQSINVYELC